jgi:hypothetical protein
MAGEDLYSALSGLGYSPLENPWGQSAAVISSSAPNLINPYGSTGQALGIALGSTLISSLLGYQARRQAAEQSLQSARLGTALLGAATPEARLGIIEGAEDPLMQQKLLNLNSQLLGQETLAKALARQQAAQAEAELPSKALLAGLAGGLVSPAEFQRQYLQKGAGQAKPGAAPTAAEKLAEVTTQLPTTAKLPEPSVDTLTAATPPQVEQLTESDATLLSPKEYEQKQNRIIRQQRDLELWTQNRRFEAEQLKDKKRITREAGKELADTAIAKEYERIDGILKTAENIAKKEKPPIGDIQKLIAMAQKTIDPSQVTLGEQELYSQVDPLFTRWETKIKSNLFGDPQISKKAINDTVDFIRNIHSVAGKKYNATAGSIANQYEVPTPDTIMRAPKYADPDAQKLETLRQLQDELAQLKAARGVK